MAVQNETGKKMVTIKVGLTRTEKDDVFVAVNGKKYLIKRGVEVRVPEVVAKVIARSEKSVEAAMAYEEKARQNMPV
jgi:thymidine phosphorylase